jgi:hypothetical protein
MVSYNLIQLWARRLAVKSAHLFPQSHWHSSISPHTAAFVFSLAVISFPKLCIDRPPSRLSIFFLRQSQVFAAHSTRKGAIMIHFKNKHTYSGPGIYVGREMPGLPGQRIGQSL